MPRGNRRTADEPFLIALACGATIEDAAHNAGISRSTAHRRLKDPEIQIRLQAIRADMVLRTSGTLAAAATEAVKTMVSLQQEANPPAVRLGAARAILEIGMKLRDWTVMEVELAALRDVVSSLKKSHHEKFTPKSGPP